MASKQFGKKSSPSSLQKFNLQQFGISKKHPAKPRASPRTPPRTKSHLDIGAQDALFTPQQGSPSKSVVEKDTPRDLAHAIDLVLDQTWLPLAEARSAKLGIPIAKLRAALPQCVLKTQLMGLHGQLSTSVDRELHSCTSSGAVRTILINGGLGGEFVVKGDHFFAVMDKLLQGNGGSENTKQEEINYGVIESAEGENTGAPDVATLHTFRQLLESRPTATTLTKDDLTAVGLDEDKLRLLVNVGFLTLCTDMNQLKTYEVSMPNFGTLMRLVKTARKWVFDSLKPRKNGVMSEAALLHKWANSKDLWTKYKGLCLTWVLLDCYGGGWIAPFATSVGPHWKLTGKKL